MVSHVIVLSAAAVLLLVATCIDHVAADEEKYAERMKQTKEFLIKQCNLSEEDVDKCKDTIKAKFGGEKPATKEEGFQKFLEGLKDCSSDECVDKVKAAAEEHMKKKSEE